MDPKAISSVSSSYFGSDKSSVETIATKLKARVPITSEEMCILSSNLLQTTDSKMRQNMAGLIYTLATSKSNAEACFEHIDIWGKALADQDKAVADKIADIFAPPGPKMPEVKWSNSVSKVLEIGLANQPVQKKIVFALSKFTTLQTCKLPATMMHKLLSMMGSADISNPLKFQILSTFVNSSKLHLDIALDLRSFFEGLLQKPPRPIDPRLQVEDIKGILAATGSTTVTSHSSKLTLREACLQIRSGSMPDSKLIEESLPPFAFPGHASAVLSLLASCADGKCTPPSLLLTFLEQIPLDEFTVGPNALGNIENLAKFSSSSTLSSNMITKVTFVLTKPDIFSTQNVVSLACCRILTSHTIPLEDNMIERLHSTLSQMPVTDEAFTNNLVVPLFEVVARHDPLSDKTIGVARKWQNLPGGFESTTKAAKNYFVSTVSSAVNHQKIDSFLNDVKQHLASHDISMTSSLLNVLSIAVDKGVSVPSVDIVPSIERIISDSATTDDKDIANICNILKYATSQTGNIKQLGPETIAMFCKQLMSAKLREDTKHDICETLAYLMSMNPRPLLQNLDQLTEALAYASRSYHLPTLSKIVKCFEIIAQSIEPSDIQNATLINLSPLTNTIIEKLPVFNELVGVTHRVAETLDSMMKKGISLPKKTLSHLIAYSTCDETFDISGRIALLHLICKYRETAPLLQDTSQAYAPPVNLSDLILNLISEDMNIALLSLKVLNSYPLTDDLLVQITTNPGIVENLILTANSSDELHLLKNEACLFLTSLLAVGYPSLQHIDFDQILKYSSYGEMQLLKALVEIGNLSLEDSLIYNLLDVALDSNDPLTSSVAIDTIVSAILHRNVTDAAQDTFDRAGILKGLELLREQGTYLCGPDPMLSKVATGAILYLTKTDFGSIDLSIDKVLEDSAQGSSIGSTKNVDQDQIAETISVSDIEATSPTTSPIDTSIISDDQLFVELATLNPGFEPGTLELLKTRFHAVQTEFAKSSCKNLTKEQILPWAMTYGKTSSPEEIIAVIIQANLLVSGNKLRSTQIISALSLFDITNTGKGRLSEIKTGEGKSTTIAVLAIMHALSGKKVDVITSSHVLAMRDAEDKKELFNLFGLTVGHNFNPEYKTGLKAAYEADIVYGDATTFEHDLLRHEHGNRYTRGDRLFTDSVAIVDEVDSMLLDESSKIAKIAGHTPGMEHLQLILTTIWQKALRLNNDPSSGNREAKVEAIKTHINKVLSEDVLILPAHLIEFAKSERQIDAWADSALRALEFDENIDYVLATDEKGLEVIAPVDYENTGIVQAKTSWVDGLHQFLQMKHELSITPETLTTSFISNLSFFKLYGPNLCGLTGTLGSEKAQNLLKETYTVDTINIPTYKSPKLVKLEGIRAASELEWLKIIASRTTEEVIVKGRASLIICNTILAAQKVTDALLKSGITNIRLYDRSDDESQASLTDNITCGEIIVATNLAGRGTDIKTSEELEANGGPHVSVTFVPKNKRIEDQAFGRTARQGKCGTAELIINLSEALKQDVTSDRIPNMVEIINARNIKEGTELDFVQKYRIPKLLAEDEVFSEYTVFKRDLLKKGLSEVLAQNLDEMWGLWLKSHSSEKIDIFDKAKFMQEFEEFKITATAAYLSPQNPAYLTRRAFDAMCSGNYQVAFRDFTSAKQKDENYNFIASYNLAYAKIRENSRYQDEYNDNIPGEAAGYLRDTEAQIRTVHIPQILRLAQDLYPELSGDITLLAAECEKYKQDDKNHPFKQILGLLPNTSLGTHLSSKLIMLDTIARYAESTASDAGNVGKGHIIIGGTKPLHEVFAGEPSYESVIAELHSAGLYTLYHIGAKAPPQRSAGLGMIVGMVAAVVATPFIGPGAWAFSSSMMSAAVGAASVGATSRLASSLYMHGGRLDRAVKDTTSARSLRGLALDAVSAGLCAGIEKKFNIGGLKDAGGNTLKGSAMHIRIAQQHAIRAGVHSAVHQESLDKSIKRETINSALASVKAGIGENIPGGGAQARLARAAMHQVTNVAYAQATGASMAAATASTMASETLGWAQDVRGASKPGEVRKWEYEDFAPALAAAATLAAGGEEQDIAVASHMANYTITYNHEPHPVKINVTEGDVDQEKQAKIKKILDEAEILETKAQTLEGSEKEFALKAAAKYREIASQVSIPQQDFDAVMQDIEARYMSGQTSFFGKYVEIVGEAGHCVLQKVDNWTDKNDYTRPIKASVAALGSMAGERIAAGATETLGAPRVQAIGAAVNDASNSIDAFADEHLAPGQKKLVHGVVGIAATYFGAKVVSSAGSFVSSSISDIAGSVRAARVGRSLNSGKLPILRGVDGKIIGVGYTQEHHILHQSLQKHPLFKKSGMSVEDKYNKILLPTTEGSSLSDSLCK